jgi:hypothetical protein
VDVGSTWEESATGRRSSLDEDQKVTQPRIAEQTVAVAERYSDSHLLSLERDAGAWHITDHREAKCRAIPWEISYAQHAAINPKTLKRESDLHGLVENELDVSCRQKTHSRLDASSLFVGAATARLRRHERRKQAEISESLNRLAPMSPDYPDSSATLKMIPTLVANHRFSSFSRSARSCPFFEVHSARSWTLILQLWLGIPIPTAFGAWRRRFLEKLTAYPALSS